METESETASSISVALFSTCGVLGNIFSTEFNLGCPGTTHGLLYWKTSRPTWLEPTALYTYIATGFCHILIEIACVLSSSDLLSSVSDVLCIIIIPLLDYLIYPHIEKAMKLKLSALHKVITIYNRFL